MRSEKLRNLVIAEKAEYCGRLQDHTQYYFCMCVYVLECGGECVPASYALDACSRQCIRELAICSLLYKSRLLHVIQTHTTAVAAPVAQ